MINQFLIRQTKEPTWRNLQQTNIQTAEDVFIFKLSVSRPYSCLQDAVEVVQIQGASVFGQLRYQQVHQLLYEITLT